MGRQAPWAQAVWPWSCVGASSEVGAGDGAPGAAAFAVSSGPVAGAGKAAIGLF